MTTFAELKAFYRDSVLLDADVNMNVVTVTHVFGDLDEKETLTANWEEQEPELLTQDGSEVLRRGVLAVATSVAVTARSRWRVDGKNWSTEKYGAAKNGTISVWVARKEVGRKRVKV